MASSDEPLAKAFSALTRELDRELWIVTARDGPQMGGLVATHVSMASIVPELPRVTVAVACHHQTWALIEASGAFALHLLGEEHLDWPLRFGLQSSRDVDKFAGLEHRPGQTGSPILDGALGWLDCRVESRLETGDRTIYVAEVVGAKAPAGGRVLTFQRWLALQSAEVRARLAEQRDHDAVIEAEAIRAWRRGHAPSRS
jgi:flavin reductase (DIM6/NTAB) family NADH-FMN oxidoreductase RutF